MTEETTANALIIALVLKNKRERAAKRKKTTKLVKQWLLQRPILGVYDALLDALLAELRLADQQIVRLLNLVAEYITKKDSHINALSICSIFVLLLEDILFSETNK